MTSLRHKLKRATSLSFAEIRDRLASRRWKQKERGGYRSRDYGPAEAKKVIEDSWQRPFYFRSTGQVDAAGFLRKFPSRKDQILAEADSVLAYKVRLFATQKNFGRLPDWQQDWKTGQGFPLSFYGDLNVLRPPPNLSIKRIWELNRMQFLVTLGQAYVLSGDLKYADGAIAWMQDWVEKNPPYLGVNWIESLEVGLRLISWTWTLQLLRGAELKAETSAKVAGSIAAQFEFIGRHLSTYSSPNTHLLGEHLALFVVGLTFPELPQAAQSVKTSKATLEEHMDSCVEGDGSYFEKSAYYHCYALDMLLQATIAGQQRGLTFSASWHEKLRKMTEFLDAIIKPNGLLARFGDDDGGRTLRLNDVDYYRPVGLLQACEAVFTDKRTPQDGPVSEDTWWLLGNKGALGSSARVEEPGTRIQHFPDADISVLRDQKTNTWVSLQGMPIARGTGGHSHAAFLSVEMTLDGQDILIDPGTYTYEGEWREPLRQVSAHNGVEVDSKTWFKSVGPFRWEPAGKRPGFLTSQETAGGGQLRRALDGGAWELIRTVSLEGTRVIIKDHLSSPAEHVLARWLHFAPQCDVRKVSETEFDIFIGEHLVKMRVVSDSAARCTLFKSGSSEKQVWMSPRYDELVASSTIRLEETISPSGGSEIIFEKAR